MPPFKKRCQALSLKKKVEILDEISKKLFKKSEIAKRFGIPKSTLSTLIKFEKQIRSAKDDGIAPGRKKLRKGAFPKLEEALVVWVTKMREKKVSVDGSLLKKKAEEFALKLGLPNGIKFSDGWIQNFKRRHNMTFRKVCGEAAAADSEAAEAWKKNRLKKILSDYKPEDIYNADETGLFYKLLPNYTLAFQGEKCTGGKLSKLRITVMLATNMTGTDKLKLFVIGKASKPRCFKGIKSLPVYYSANKKAWMTEILYGNWLRQLDHKLHCQNRKIVLIVDNCTAHGVIKDLKAITVEFLPPNVTSTTQPMDQGVIQSFKRNYRKSLLNRVILNIEHGKEYEVDLLSAIYLAAAAWDSVTAQTISNCFGHAGFKQQETGSNDVTLDDNEALDIADPDHRDNEGDNLIAVLREKGGFPENINFEKYLNADRNLECHEGITEEAILNSIRQKYEEEKVSSGEDEDPGEDIGLIKRVRPTLKQATDAVDVLRSFFETTENSEEMLQLVIKIENRVLSCSSILQQAKVTRYFRP